MCACQSQSPSLSFPLPFPPQVCFHIYSLADTLLLVDICGQWKILELLLNFICQVATVSCNLAGLPAQFKWRISTLISIELFGAFLKGWGGRSQAPQQCFQSHRSRRWAHSELCLRVLLGNFCVLQADCHSPTLLRSTRASPCTFCHVGSQGAGICPYSTL